MPTVLGVNFWGGGGLKPLRNKAEKFAEEVRLKKSLRNFAVNSPKIRRTKVRNSTKIRSAGPRDVHSSWRNPVLAN